MRGAISLFLVCILYDVYVHFDIVPLAIRARIAAGSPYSKVTFDEFDEFWRIAKLNLIQADSRERESAQENRVCVN